jgi:DNA-binding transcriptional regulator YdaS (Cro superfamily)
LYYLSTGIEQAIESAGSQRKLAELLGVSQQVISGWLAQGYVPAGRVVETEQHTGVPRLLLVNPALRELITPSDL